MLIILDIYELYFVRILIYFCVQEVFGSMDKGQLPSASVLLLVSQSITTVTNLARDPSVRTVLAGDSELWKFSARLIVSFSCIRMQHLFNEITYSISF